LIAQSYDAKFRINQGFAAGIIQNMTFINKIKAKNPINHIKKHNPSPIIEIYFECAHLKNLFRKGWLTRGIPTERCESVAEHSFGMAVSAMIFAESFYPELDLLKILRMALIHDFGEIYVGDIIPGDPISHKEKYELEKESILQIFSKLPNGNDYIALWEEYEKGGSPEAQFVRQIDRLEMALQALIYEHQEQKNLGKFFQSARADISSSELAAILNEIEDLR
jgi:putative hydrolase of HD superfamily